MFTTEDCFTLLRAEWVRKPLSRNHARSTVWARSPVSPFTRKTRTRINLLSRCITETSYDCSCIITRKMSLMLLSRCRHEGRHTTVSALSRAKFVNSNLLSRRTHEERHNHTSVLSHAKSVSNPCSRYHAKIIMRQIARPRQHHNSRLGRQQSSSFNSHDE